MATKKGAMANNLCQLLLCLIPESFFQIQIEIEIAPSVPYINSIYDFPEICLGTVLLPENFTITGIVTICTFGGQIYIDSLPNPSSSSYIQFFYTFKITITFFYSHYIILTKVLQYNF